MCTDWGLPVHLTVILHFSFQLTIVNCNVIGFNVSNLLVTHLTSMPIALTVTVYDLFYPFLLFPSLPSRRLRPIPHLYSRWATITLTPHPQPLPLTLPPISQATCAVTRGVGGGVSGQMTPGQWREAAGSTRATEAALVAGAGPTPPLRWWIALEVSAGLTTYTCWRGSVSGPRYPCSPSIHHGRPNSILLGI